MNEDLGPTYELSPLIEQPTLKTSTLQHGTRRSCADGTHEFCDQGFISGLLCVAERHDEVVPTLLDRHRLIQTIIVPSGIGIMGSHIV